MPDFKGIFGACTRHMESAKGDGASATFMKNMIPALNAVERDVPGMKGNTQSMMSTLSAGFGGKGSSPSMGPSLSSRRHRGPTLGL